MKIKKEFLGLLILSLATVSCKTHCATFHFPTLQHSQTVAAQEHDNITIPFAIQYEQDCVVPEDFVLEVSKRGNRSETHCYLRHQGGVCQQLLQSKCKCGTGRDGMYYMVHTASRKDNPPVRWIWSGNDERIENQTITFNVTSALQIINLIQSSRTPDGTTQLDLEVRSHTATFQRCQLQTVLTCNVTEVTGSPPDLTVSIRLGNVRKKDQGTWRLTLTTDEGAGSFELPEHAIATREDITTQTESMPSTKSSPSLDVATSAAAEPQFSADYIATVVAVAFVVIVGCVNITVICVKKVSRADGLRPVRQEEEPANPEPALPDDGHRSSTESGESVNT